MRLLFNFFFCRDAEDAVRGRDGYDYDGYRLRVEFPRGQGPRGPGGRLYGDRGGYGGPRGGGSFSSGGGRRTQYRVIISGLPASGKHCVKVLIVVVLVVGIWAVLYFCQTRLPCEFLFYKAK